MPRLVDKERRQLGEIRDAVAVQHNCEKCYHNKFDRHFKHQKELLKQSHT